MATAKTWRARIRKATEDAGTYRPFFDMPINALADVLARKDAAMDLFIKSGGQTVVAHTNKAGATNLEKNPCLRVVEECEHTALAYWRELGLTPAGLKRIIEESMKDAAPVSALDKILFDLEGIGEE